MYTSLCYIHAQFLNLKSLLDMVEHLLGIFFSFDAFDLYSIIRHCHVKTPT